MQHRTGSMENDYPVTPKSVLYSVTVPVKENIILVNKSMYKYIPLLNLRVLTYKYILVHTITYFLEKVYTGIYRYMLFLEICNC